ncbi:FadR/GntR family transcriptional regulator [Microbacterium aurantiacum]|uniref:FadR family transcriptional regulator n=1 Tax=Microbacterium aurantiacum TaxID=162393 RepID=A0AAJ2LZC5_9MICO|nr:FadR/GntR family transcriptional regulator [Microbacterium aurantiacum]MDS0244331.1 FadR family transcriptional regulator [Microbacterium aurantiacum]
MSNDTPYERLTPKPLWTAAADQIRERIESGDIPVGARLPSERDLCAQFGISRISLRESLRVLQSTGYVETRPGSGTYARLPEPIADGSLAAWIAKDIHILELFELRRAVEPGIAGLAALQRKEAHLGPLEATITQMAGDSPRDHPRVVAADAEFHRLIGHSIGNPAISRLIDQIQDEGGAERRLSLGVPGQTQRAVDDHSEIFDAIRRQDEVGARDAMRAHLDDAVDWIVTYTKEHLPKEEQ